MEGLDGTGTLRHLLLQLDPQLNLARILDRASSSDVLDNSADLPASEHRANHDHRRERRPDHRRSHRCRSNANHTTDLRTGRLSLLHLL